MCRTRASLGVVFAFGLALGAVIAGCSQGVGERCQVDRDCESGTFCSGTNDPAGGICQPVNQPQTDAAPTTADGNDDVVADAETDGSAAETAEAGETVDAGADTTNDIAADESAVDSLDSSDAAAESDAPAAETEPETATD